MEAVPEGEGLTFFKYEGFVVHVEARTLDAGRELLNVALACGYKNSGMVIGKRYMVGIRGTLKIDAPITENGRWVVPDEYLELLGRLANDKFQENDRRLDKFEAQVRALVSDSRMMSCHRLRRILLSFSFSSAGTGIGHKARGREHEQRATEG